MNCTKNLNPIKLILISCILTKKKFKIFINFVKNIPMESNILEMASIPVNIEEKCNNIPILWAKKIKVKTYWKYHKFIIYRFDLSR